METKSAQNSGIGEIERLKEIGYNDSDLSIFDNRIRREWLNTKEAAHFLGMSENAIRIMVHRGQIQVYKFGRRLRFRIVDCQALFQKKGA